MPRGPTFNGGAFSFAGNGGGASDVRTCSAVISPCAGALTSLGSRLLVAGGGGGPGVGPTGALGSAGTDPSPVPPTQPVQVPPATPVQVPPAPTLQLTIAAQTTLVTRRTGLLTACSLSSGAISSCRVTMRAGRLTIGSGASTAATTEARLFVTIRLNRAGRRLLLDRRSRHLAVTLTAVASGDGSVHTVTSRAHILSTARVGRGWVDPCGEQDGLAGNDSTAA